MPNLAAVLKDEVARLARKEIRRETSTMRKATAQYRRDIAALKRQAAALERQIALLERTAPLQTPKIETTANADKQLRFTAKGLRSQRKRLGLAAGDYAKLVGVTPQSIYNWERGTAKPRQSQIAVLAALRGIGKKEAAAKLGQLPKAAPKKAKPAKKATPKQAKQTRKAAPKKVARKKAAPKKATPKKAKKGAAKKKA